MQIINCLVPIFAVIGLGWLLRRNKFLTGEMTEGFNRFAYFFALPLFLFYKLGTATLVAGTANRFMLTLLLATIGTGFLSWVSTIVLKTEFKSRGALIQGCFRGNLAFMGLPLILFLMADLPEAEKLEAAILVALPPIVILYNVCSVLVLAVYNETNESSFSWQKVIFNIVTNPLLLACAAGLIAQRSQFQMPVSMYRTCEVVGSAAFPMALIGIGSQLAVTSISGHWFSLIFASVFKCVVCPLIGWGVAAWLGLAGIELQIILMMCAVPTAVSSFVLADQMKADSELAAGTVVFCTLFSIISLSVLILLTG